MLSALLLLAGLRVAGGHPEFPVIIKHLGCPTLADLTEPVKAAAASGREAPPASAALPPAMSSLNIMNRSWRVSGWDHSAAEREGAASNFSSSCCNRGIIAREMTCSTVPSMA